MVDVIAPNFCCHMKEETFPYLRKIVRRLGGNHFLQEEGSFCQEFRYFSERGMLPSSYGRSMGLRPLPPHSKFSNFYFKIPEGRGFSPKIVEQMGLVGSAFTYLKTPKYSRINMYFYEKLIINCIEKIGYFTTHKYINL